MEIYCTCIHYALVFKIAVFVLVKFVDHVIFIYEIVAQFPNKCPDLYKTYRNLRIQRLIFQFQIYLFAKFTSLFAFMDSASTSTHNYGKIILLAPILSTLPPFFHSTRIKSRAFSSLFLHFRYFPIYW